MSPVEIPYGVWQSNEPYILLDIQYPVGASSGKYERDGLIIDTRLEFTIKGRSLGIRPTEDQRRELWETERISSYLAGTFTFTEDKLVYKLSKHFRDQYGIRSITFTKIQDYDPPEEDN
jgi:membrane peptidoglycan carboxypeptidase